MECGVDHFKEDSMLIKKKICILGAFAVGKTSLVQRFVKSTFSEKYLTTIGVKIDQKTVETRSHNVKLAIWDIHGEDDFQEVRASYLKGASGFFLVVDGTRKATLDVAKKLELLAKETIGAKPFVVLVNKSDLDSNWEFTTEMVKELRNKGWHIVKTSAKTGENVEESFQYLAERMVSQ